MRYLACWREGGANTLKHNTITTHQFKSITDFYEKRRPILLLDIKTDQVLINSLGLVDASWFRIHYKNWADYRRAKRYWDARSWPKSKLSKLQREERSLLRRQKFLARKLNLVRRKIKHLCKTQTVNPSTHRPTNISDSSPPRLGPSPATQDASPPGNSSSSR